MTEPDLSALRERAAHGDADATAQLIELATERGDLNELRGLAEAWCGPDLGFRRVRAGFSDPAFVMFPEGPSGRQGTLKVPVRRRFSLALRVA